MNLFLLLIILTLSKPETLTVTSTAFKNKESIPKKYTCQGQNINPPIHIEGIPATAKSLVLIVDDPDAPMGTFDHWVMWNIPVKKDIAESTSPGVPGKNGTGEKGYMGPCPPSGTHRYFFKVYALDNTLDLQDVDKKAVENAIKGHVLAQGELIGLYKKE